MSVFRALFFQGFQLLHMENLKHLAIRSAAMTAPHLIRVTSAQGLGALNKGTGLSLDQLMLRQELRPGLKVMVAALGGSLANLSRRLNPSAGGHVHVCVAHPGPGTAAHVLSLRERCCSIGSQVDLFRAFQIDRASGKISCHPLHTLSCRLWMHTHHAAWP